MAGETHRLPEVAKFALMVVKAPLDDVLSYFRCFLGETNDNRDPKKFPHFREVRGPQIREERVFGLCGHGQVHPEYRDFYEIWGRFRVSTAPGRPDLVLIEGCQAHNEILSDILLAVYLRRPVYVFSSRIAWDLTSGVTPHLPYREPRGQPGEHLMARVYEGYERHTDRVFDDRDRTIWVSHDGSRWRFQNDGTPEPFEQVDAYGARLKADRLTRNMICAYMEAVGVDPERTFVGREVENAVLFSSQMEGDEIVVDPDVLADYARRMDDDGVTWGPNAAG